MTDRYVSAASVSAMLHAVVIALLLWFSLQSRPELNDLSKAAPFILIGSAGSTADVSAQEHPLTLPLLPTMKPVPSEPAAPVENVAPIKAHEAVAPLPKSPARGRNETVPSRIGPKAAPVVHPPAPPPRISSTWQFGPGSGTQNATPSTLMKEAGSAQAAPEREAYLAELRRRLRAALSVPPGVPAKLVTNVKFLLAADGTLSSAKIITPSGDVIFDRAVLAAIARTRVPARPDGTSEWLEVTLSTEAMR